MMSLIESQSPEVLGMLFCLGIVAIGICLGIFIKSAIKPTKNDLSDIILDSKENELKRVSKQLQPTREVLYELEHYDLKFSHVEGLWYSYIVMGDHVSPITTVNPNAKFRNLMMDVFLCLKIKKSNQKQEASAF
jgi:hypothetical protein